MISRYHLAKEFGTSTSALKRSWPASPRPDHYEAIIQGGVSYTRVPFSGWGESSPALLGGHVEGLVAEPDEVNARILTSETECILLRNYIS